LRIISNGDCIFQKSSPSFNEQFENKRFTSFIFLLHICFFKQYDRFFGQFKNQIRIFKVAGTHFLMTYQL